MLSIVIPSRNERFLTPTIKDLLKNSQGEIEILVHLDGYWPSVKEIVDDPRVRYVHSGTSIGMRGGINKAVAAARGDIIMKIDGHCMVSPGYDVEIARHHIEDNLVMIPRRKRLDAENWCIQDVGKRDIDYEYLSFPDNPNDFGGKGLNGKIWDQRSKERIDVMIDDNMSFQGSCWIMKRKYFDWLELMDEENYGTFWNEAQEIGLKAWLSGGRVVTNKNIWYAHLHKGKKYGRGYFLNKNSVNQGAEHTRGWMLNNRHWHKQTKDFNWLIEHFWPVPTWPEDRSLWEIR